MIKQFPEIVYFFKQDSFTQDDLDSLKNNVQRFYDKPTSKIAISLIELNIAKFAMGFEVKKPRPKIKVASKSKNKKTTSTKKLVHAIQEKDSDVINEFSEKIKNTNLEQLALELGISFINLKRFLARFGIEKHENEFLNSKEFEKISYFILSRTKAMGRKSIPNRIFIKQSKNQKSTKSAGVYDLIKKNGGLGKIIYTKMRG